MSEMKTLLERASAHVRENHAAFEELERRRTRRTATRRVTAGAVAVVVAIAGVAAVSWAFGQGSPVRRPISESVGRFEGIWPETSLAELRAAETSDELPPWRLDPLDTVETFVQDVLGWEPHIRSEHVSGGAASYTAVHEDCRRPGSTATTCQPAGKVTVSLARFGAYWSVTGVQSPGLEVGIDPGDQFAADHVLRAAADSSRGTAVVGGGRYWGADCSGSLTAEPLSERGAYGIFVPQAFAACGQQNVRGYVYLAVIDKPVANGPTYDPLRTSMDPLDALSLVPVTFNSTPSSSGAAYGFVQGRWFDGRGYPLGHQVARHGTTLHFDVRDGSVCAAAFIDVSEGLLGPRGLGTVQEYVRDPTGSLHEAGFIDGRFDPNTKLPNRAVYTGIHHSAWQIYAVPDARDRRAIYLVHSPVPGGAPLVERWPLGHGTIDC
jgi:hypothetical protein